MKENSWLLVANQEKARLYKVVKIGQLQEILDFEHPQRTLKESDVYSSPPGRSFNSPGGNGPKGKQGDTRHAYEPHTTFKDKKDNFFAREIIKYLADQFDENAFKSLYVVAEPHFLGILKKHFSNGLLKATENFVSKDVVNFSTSDIWEHSEIV